MVHAWLNLTIDVKCEKCGCGFKNSKCFQHHLKLFATTLNFVEYAVAITAQNVEHTNAGSFSVEYAKVFHDPLRGFIVL